MGTFGMNTEDVHSAGANINKLAEEWGYAKKKIDETVEKIVDAYPSSDGIEIANKIHEYDPMLNRMYEKLAAHGSYGVYASNKTASTNEDIRSNIARNL